MNSDIAPNSIMDANKAKLVDFLAIPKACRPMPLKAFAKVLGVSEPTVHAWKKQPEVIAAIRNMIRRRFANDIPDVLLALRDSALSGNPSAAKYFIEYVESGIEDPRQPEDEITKEEVQRVLREFRRKNI